jgi:hypothetical protein
VTFLEAAIVVLKASRRPLTAGEITGAALHKGLLQTRGETPEATMSAALYRAPVDGPIQREYAPGEKRAIRGSVRWTYVGQRR